MELEIVEQFPTTLNADIAKKFGISITTIIRIKKKYNLKKDEEFYRCWFRENSVVSEKCKDADVNKRRVANMTEARRKQARSEKRRLMYGLPQRTRLRFNLLSHSDKSSKRNYKYRLKKNGYINVDDIYYYTSETNRNVLTEKRASEKFNFKFCEYGND